MTDFATQRKSMVDSQVRPSDVTDRRVPRAMLEVAREAFVPAALKSIAYMDNAVRVSGGRSLMAPRVFAKLVQHLEITADAAVLDVGTATGYSAAVMARMARRVVALESDAALAEQAQGLLRELPNVKVRTGELAAGAAGDGPFDAILVNGAVEAMPHALLDQLKDGGRLVAIMVTDGVGKATMWRRYQMRFDQRPMFDAGAAVLPGFARKAEFVF